MSKTTERCIECKHRVDDHKHGVCGAPPPLDAPADRIICGCTAIAHVGARGVR